MSHFISTPSAIREDELPLILKYVEGRQGSYKKNSSLDSSLASSSELAVAHAITIPEWTQHDTPLYRLGFNVVGEYLHPVYYSCDYKAMELLNLILKEVGVKRAILEAQKLNLPVQVRVQ